MQLYLHAVPFPYHPFFCYRTAAVLWEGRRDFIKATKLYRKALDLYPEDLFCLKRYGALTKDQNSVDKQVDSLIQHYVTQRLTSLKKQSQKNLLRHYQPTWHAYLF